MEKPLQTAERKARSRILSSLIGHTFGMVKVLRERRVKPVVGRSQFLVQIECECGVKKWVAERSVRRGKSRSCGRCANKTHGGSRTPEYAVWRSMLARCNNPRHKAYPNYGGRGITVCKEWGDFEVFLADMGKQPFKGASIERKDNSLGYTPHNCIWATYTQQSRNRRSNRLLTAFGETKTITEWAEQTGLRHNTICYRLDSGWGADKALTVTPNPANRVDGDC
jgi:hypothetical protein